jgi:hypothetical protein
MHRALNYKLWESTYGSIGSVGLRIPDQINLSDKDIEDVRNIEWTNLDWEDFGNDGGSIVWLKMTQPFTDEISKGIVVDIQLIQELFYQIHISLAEDLRGIGLGTKIYRSVVDWTGHLYSGKGRRQNPIVNKVWDNLKNEEGVTCASNDLGDICVSDKNPDKDKLLEMFMSI